jgi:hypothetical protein
MHGEAAKTGKKNYGSKVNVEREMHVAETKRKGKEAPVPLND